MSFVYKFLYANIAYLVTLNFRIDLNIFLFGKKDFENTVYILKSTIQCFKKMFLWAFPFFKKSFSFQVMAPSKMSAPMVEKYDQREIIFHDEQLLKTILAGWINDI